MNRPNRSRWVSTPIPPPYVLTPLQQIYLYGKQIPDPPLTDNPVPLAPGLLVFDQYYDLGILEVPDTVRYCTHEHVVCWLDLENKLTCHCEAWKETRRHRMYDKVDNPEDPAVLEVVRRCPCPGRCDGEVRLERWRRKRLIEWCTKYFYIANLDVPDEVLSCTHEPAFQQGTQDSDEYLERQLGRSCSGNGNGCGQRRHVAQGGEMPLYVNLANHKVPDAVLECTHEVNVAPYGNLVNRCHCKAWTDSRGTRLVLRLDDRKDSAICNAAFHHKDLGPPRDGLRKRKRCVDKCKGRKKTGGNETSSINFEPPFNPSIPRRDNETVWIDPSTGWQAVQISHAARDLGYNIP
ncbi:hypothetical protein CspHIS471_0210360 [Cutaneotrichosporon sp. HIS471]|nr:hypothetical protein CspHIS471_0210360 [Cutaneotrichosporon sp. HIS471]